MKTPKFKKVTGYVREDYDVAGLYNSLEEAEEHFSKIRLFREYTELNNKYDIFKDSVYFIDDFIPEDDAEKRCNDMRDEISRLIDIRIEMIKYAAKNER